MTTRLALVLLALMLLLAIAGCHYLPGITFEGHIAGRYMLNDSTPVVIVVGAHGDTAHVRTSIETYVDIPDIYYQAEGAVLTILPSAEPAGHNAAALLQWYEPAIDSRIRRQDTTAIKLDTVRWIDRGEVDVVKVVRKKGGDSPKE